MSRQDRFRWFAAQQQKKRRLRTSSRSPSRGFTLSRRLHIEPLEDRRMLAVITVTSSADDLVVDGMVTLREAVQAANTDTGVDGSVAGSGADTINFSTALSGNTITLGGTDLEITEALTIDATALAADVTIDADELSRIFNITATNGDFTLAGLTLTGGKTTGDNIGTVTTFSGGAIRSLTTGSLTIDQSTISNSSTTGASYGGGIFSSGDFVLTSSTVSGNSTASLFGFGGGIFTYGTTSINSSTISGNSTTGDGGAGAGIFAFGSMTIASSTISGNSASGNLADGGGLYMYNPTSVPTLTIQNSILAGNTAGGSNPDLSPGTGTMTVDFSLIGDTSGSGITGATGTGNVLDQDPLLGLLADNGGPTQTHALLAGSPAIDTGDPSILFDANEFDQRGSGTPGFVRVFDGDASAGAQIDMGAFEVQTISLIVDSLLDESDGDFSTGDLSLREAVELTNANPGDDTITFDTTVFATPQTIALVIDELMITDAVTIDASALAQNVTIDAGNGPDNIFNTLDGFRIFHIDDGDDTTLIDVELIGLTLTGGDLLNFSGSGGAIYSRGENLAVTSSTIIGNSTGGNGGGISTRLGVLTITSSTISGNASGNLGGGISPTGVTTITSSTISGNSAASGGGIHTQGTAQITITSSTISDNTGVVESGGIFHPGGTVLTLSHSVVAGNELANSTRIDIAGPIEVTSDFNIIGVDTGLIGLSDGTAGNQIGTSGMPIDPLLGALADRGGRTQTHALLAGSPAIDAGDPLIVAPPANDQRGAPFLRQIGTIDVGAFEVQVIPSPLLVVDTLIDENDGDYTAGDLSLREAIGLANTIGSINSITFDAALSGGTINLSQALGELAIIQQVTIDASSLDTGITIDAGDGTDNTFGTGDGFRIFNINDSTVNEIVVQLSNLTLTGGDVSPTNATQSHGGAIISSENLTISNSSISGNSASSNGGGIYANGPTTIISSTISGNSSVGVGGAVFTSSNVLTIVSSTISENSAGTNGGGLAITSSNTTITSSTINNNVSESVGGGIAVSNSVITIAASTITGNLAGSSGGGIRVLANTTMTITSSTITGNRADSDNNGVGLGGGIRRYSGSVTLSHTLIAGNEKGISTKDDFFGALQATSSFNLIGVDTGLTGISDGIAGNQIGTSGAPLDPLLGALADNGGPTQTHALLAGSPAIDAGDPGIVFDANEFDQRGAPFVRVANGGVNGVRIDIGAYESIALIVDTLVDENDGDFSSGDLSLREATVLANMVPGAETITFAAALDGGTIDLQQALDELAITDALTIDASSLATGITIDAGDGTDNTFATGDGIRIFNIDDSTAMEIDVELVGLTLTGGDVSLALGGAISSQENLTITSSTIRDNSASNGGGGISVNSAAVTITSSTFSGNSTGGDGGGIAIVASTTTIASSTISGNSASDDGGGIRISGTSTIIDSTISGNTAANDSGGIYIVTGTTTIVSSTISGNTAGIDGGGVHIRTGTTTITSSTISGNSAGDEGGGVFSFLAGVSATITHSTITDNRADNDNSGSGTGGGVRINLGNVTLSHVLVAGNDLGDSTADDISGSVGVSSDFNLIGVDTGLAGISDGTAGNQIGTSGAPIDPLLGPLTDNGGPTGTHELLLSSPALEAGDPAIVAPPAFDQRGVGFPRLHGTIDIGAFEGQGLLLVVDTLVDENDGDISAGDFSLREAIDMVNGVSGADTIIFDAALDGGTIDLLQALGELTITDEVAIDASSLASGLTIDAGDGTDNLFDTNDGFRIFNINDGSGTDIPVQLVNLTLTGGDLQGSNGTGGGAIDTQEDLTLTSVTIVGNSGFAGGGIRARFGTLTIVSSTISGNIADRGGGIYASGETTTIDGSTISNNTGGGSGIGGGGIRSQSGSLSITSSTISGNSVPGSNNGGGISLQTSPLTITSSTVSGNSTGRDGGGIHESNTTVTIVSSTISGNTADGEGGGIFATNTLTITSSTITGNRADNDNNGFGSGGGIQKNISGSLILSHTLIAENDLGNSTQDDISSVVSVDVSSDFNLIGVDTGFTGITDGVAGNQIGTSGAPIDPLLGPLADNGGPTETHALLAGSLAIDTGDLSISSPPLFDQRGAPFERQNGTIDIGAFEFQTPIVPSADFDGSGFVTGLDFLAWQRGFGTPAPTAAKTDGDADNDGDVDGVDLGFWESQFGQAAPLAVLSLAEGAPVSLNRESIATAEPIAAITRSTSVQLATAAQVAIGLPTSIHLRVPSFGSRLNTVWENISETIRFSEVVDLAFDNVWDDFEARVYQADSMVADLVDRSTSSSDSDYDQAIDDLFASVAEQRGRKWSFDGTIF